MMKDLIINKIKKAKTDTLPMPTKLEKLEKRPEVNNLFGIIYSSIKGYIFRKIYKRIFRKKFFRI